MRQLAGAGGRRGRGRTPGRAHLLVIGIHPDSFAAAADYHPGFRGCLFT
ncbi:MULTISPECIES: hypothetical protein [Streptomyces]|nr:hypothetical protein [Streptomyces murinus]MBA9050561.1 hypothetical protein [Streptomyces murinus]